MDDEKNELAPPKKQSLFPLTPDDIVDNALQNLDEKQAREVTQKAADEIVQIAVEKRRAEYRNSAAREEMKNVVENANILDQTVSEYKINSTFETASGTTSVEIQNSNKSNFNPLIYIVLGIGLIVILLLVFFVMQK
jgi:hypothetical protein